MVNGRLLEHHEAIVDFFEKIDSQAYYRYLPVKNIRQKEMLTQITQAKDGLLHYSDFSDPLENLDIEALSKIRGSLNDGLREFSRKYGIAPALKLYFRTKGDKSPGGHFACCEIPKDKNSKEFKEYNPAVSNKFISTKILEENLQNAELKIEKRYSEHSNIQNNKKDSAIELDSNDISPFMTIEERLEKKLGRYPCLEDIENGNYYRIKKYHDSIKSKLLSNKKCLIKATPGCGKTSLALALGYEFSQKKISVYYYDASTASNVRKWKQFIQNCGKDDLIILDNVHTRVAEVNELIANFINHDAMLMVISRDIPRSSTYSRPFGSTHHISYMDFFHDSEETETLQIDKDTTFHIVNWYVNNKEIQKEQIGDINAVIKKSQGDYNLLRFYIEAWKKGNYTESLAEMEEREILDYVYHHYLQDCPYQKELLKISVLTQSEINVDSKWITKDFQNAYDKLSDLQEGGLIQFTEETTEDDRKIFWLRIYHSTVAGYYLKAAANSFNCYYIDDVENFTTECFKGYLKSKPFNFFQVCSDMLLWNYKEDRFTDFFLESGLCEISERIMQEESQQYIKYHQFVIFVYIRDIITKNPSLGSWAIERLFKPLLHCQNESLSMLFALRSISEMYNIVSKANLDSGFVTSQLDFRSLGEKTCINNDWAVIWSFLDFAGRVEVSKEKIQAFCNGLDITNLEKGILNKNANWREIFTYIVCNNKIGLPGEQITSLCDKINFKTLGKQAAEDDIDWIGLGLITKYIFNAGSISKNQMADFCHSLNFKKLGEDAPFGRLMGWGEISTLVISLARDIEVPSRQIRDFCEGIDLKSLANRIKEDDGLVINLGLFLYYIAEANVKQESIYHFCQTLNFKKLGQQTGVNVGWANIWHLIFALKEIEFLSDFSDDFCRGVDFVRLGSCVQHKKDWNQLWSLARDALELEINIRYIKDFYEGMDYVKLKEPMRIANALAELWIMTCDLKIVGMSKEVLSDLWEGVDFRELGKQTESQKRGWEQVDISIRNALEIGIPKKSICEFCESIDFRRISNELKQQELAGIEVLGFVSDLFSVGVDQGCISDFCKFIDFGIIGEQLFKKEIDWRKTLFFISLIDKIGIEDKQLDIFCEQSKLETVGAIITRERNAGSNLVWMFLLSSPRLNKHKQSLCRGIGLYNLAEQIQESGAPWDTILRFVHKKLHEMELSVERKREFCEGIDFKKIGKHAQKDEIILDDALNIIFNAEFVGMSKKDVRDFCEQIDFSSLGRKTDINAIGWRNLTGFFLQAKEQGVGKDKIVDLSKEISFTELGKQASGQIELNVFCILLSDFFLAETIPDSLANFFNQLDFYSLGKKAFSVNMDLKSISVAVDNAKLIGVSEKNTNDFYEGYALGGKQPD